MENQTVNKGISKEPLSEQNVLKSFPGKGGLRKKSFSLIFVSFLVVLFGITTGWVLARGTGLSENKATNQPSSVEKSDGEMGNLDESKFKDSEAPEGILKEGGIEGEGTHHLERPGGDSQTVYLTSTVISLQGFVDKKVKVWGETVSAIHAGWLMDVGKIKTLD